MNKKEQHKEISPNGASKKQKKPRLITESYLKNAGAFYLQRYPASITQFERAMSRKIKRSLDFHGKPSQSDAEEFLAKTIEEFTRLGYLNDETYTKALITSLYRRGTSLQKIRAKLFEKGIEKSLAEHLINELLPQNHALISACIFLYKKRRAMFALRPEKADYEKNLATLARQGFDYTTAQLALAMTKEDAENEIEKRDLL